MHNHYTFVKNPLTVVAVFSGVAEIGGTIVLPIIAQDVQATYIWFLMLFPFALIAIFFLTLNFNHRVLYAPSDFKDEDNFVHILKKSTPKDVLELKEGEVSEVDEPEVDSVDIKFENISNPESNKNFNFEAKRSEEFALDSLIAHANSSLDKTEDYSTKEQRDQIDLLSRRITKFKMREMRLAEGLALKRLSEELGTPIEAEMQIQSKGGSVRFDGVARLGSALAAIEVKFFRTRRSISTISPIWGRLKNNLESLFQSLDTEQQREFSFVLVIVCDENGDELKVMAAKQLINLPFPVALKLYRLEELIAQYGGGNDG